VTAAFAGQAVTVLGWLDLAVITYFLAINACYLVLMVSAGLELRRHGMETRAESYVAALSSELMPAVTVLVPAYNEAATIRSSLQALLTQAYPNLEVVVVDDGSTDGTVALLVDAFDLVPAEPMMLPALPTAEVAGVLRSRRFANLLVATKSNGGKADALNTALNLASGELVCAVDADTIVEADGLRRLVRPFIRSADVVGAGATIRVANGCLTRNGRIVDERVPNRLLTGVQAVEYLRAFLFGRLGWNLLGGNLVVSGAFGLFRREALIASGGYSGTVGEDMELVVRLRRHGYERNLPSRIEFVPDPIAWTEAPGSLSALGRQRERWHRGLSDTLWRHRRLFGNPRFGVLGLVTFPAFVIVEWFGPVVEAVGMVAVPLGLLLGAIDPPLAALFFAAAYGLGLVLSATALLLEELAFRGYRRPLSRGRLLGWALLENLGYRQLTVYWRLRGIVGQLRGRTEWGVMHRKGFTTQP
jgi:cellulose synthase/poly-beta-1,6-N-acetylglucosamine synthase-like glycosyltransferase